MLKKTCIFTLMALLLLCSLIPAGTAEGINNIEPLMTVEITEPLVPNQDNLYAPPWLATTSGKLPLRNNIAFGDSMYKVANSEPFGIYWYGDDYLYSHPGFLNKDDAITVQYNFDASGGLKEIVWSTHNAVADSNKLTRLYNYLTGQYGTPQKPLTDGYYAVIGQALTKAYVDAQTISPRGRVQKCYEWVMCYRNNQYAKIELVYVAALDSTWHSYYISFTKVDKLPTRLAPGPWF